MSPVFRSLAVLGLGIVAVASARPAWAGIEEAVKALQAGDVTTAEKNLQALVKERDPRAQSGDGPVGDLAAGAGRTGP